MSEFTLIREKRGSVLDSYVITDDVIDQTVKTLENHIHDYFNGINPDSFAVAHRETYIQILKVYLMKAVMTNNIVKYMNYDDKVLFVPSFYDNRYDEIRNQLDVGNGDTRTLYMENIAVHMYPIINKVFNLGTDVRVAYPSSHTSLWKYLMECYNVTFMDCNKIYKLGDDTWTLTNTDNVEFDMVLLAGNETSDENNYFNASDIKADFAGHCKSEFILYDDYGDNELKRQCLIDDNVGTHYNLDARIRGDLHQTNRIEFSNWLASNLIPHDMVIDTQASTMLARLASESRKLMRIY